LDLLKIKEERRLQRGGPQDRNPGATLLCGASPTPSGVGIFSTSFDKSSSPEGEDEMSHLSLT